MFSRRVLLIAAVVLAACHLTSAQSWDDCKTTSMVLTNGYRFRNLDVTAYSRLGNNATTLDCLNKCRADQDCYSFNYDKVKKWCYLSLSEKTALTAARDGKFAAGYRKCVAHSGNGAWENPALNGGQEGTAPSGLADPIIALVANKVTVTYTAPTEPGTIDGTNYAGISVYAIKCSGAVSFTTTAADVGTYTYTAVTLTTNTDGPVSCTVTATNTASMTVSASATSTLVAT